MQIQSMDEIGSPLHNSYPMAHTQWALQLALAAISGMSGMPLMLGVYNQESGYRELHNAFPRMSVSIIRLSMLIDRFI